ncbi:unnamed protein product [Prunus armeniaca]|uniref:Retrotransposon gag domain-containing protein n=1 Tax=Prunus armeniaca TaxID=36596 RepID=A0A6J5U8Y7_PRUAR|nr:unnamed protein product [Prunus armeniaca]
MEILNATDPNAEANFNVRDMMMKRVRAIPDLLMERTVRSCKLSSLALTTYSLVSLACQPKARRNILTKGICLRQRKLNIAIVKSIMIVIGKSISLKFALMQMSMLEKKLEVCLTGLEREQGPGLLDLAMTTNTLPFTRDIIEFKLPKDFKQPMMQLYDGTTDLVDFLNNFSYWMNVKNARDTMKCRAFPLLLEVSAKDWFKSLKSDSINSFDLFKQSFVNQFLFASKKRYPPNYLLSIRHGHKEKLPDYINHFNRESYEDLVSKAYRHAIVEEMTYDTLEGKDPSQSGVGDKWREDHNDVHEKPDYKKGRFENSRRGGPLSSDSYDMLQLPTPNGRFDPPICKTPYTPCIRPSTNHTKVH